MIKSYFLENKLEVNLKKIKIIKDILLASVHSKLLFAIYKREKKDMNKIFIKLENEINIILSQL